MRFLTWIFIIRIFWCAAGSKHDVWHFLKKNSILTFYLSVSLCLLNNKFNISQKGVYLNLKAVIVLICINSNIEPFISKHIWLKLTFHECFFLSISKAKVINTKWSWLILLSNCWFYSSKFSFMHVCLLLFPSLVQEFAWTGLKW